MGITSSSSGKSRLPEIRQQILEWTSRQDFISKEVPWTKSHLPTVIDYVSKLEGINSSYSTPLSPGQVLRLSFDHHNPKKFAKMLECFTQNLRELFNVPKLEQLSHRDKSLKKNELVAAFINFLLRLLHHRTDYMKSFEPRIKSLETELRLLVTILGDAVFYGAASEQVENLLAVFEAVANDAGRLVYCFVFTTYKVFKSIAVKIDKAFDALSKRIDQLKSNIIKFSNLDSGMAEKAAAVDSLFILNCLLNDLEDIVKRDSGLFVDVMDQIKILHQEMVLLTTLLKDLKVDRHSEIEELREPLVWIRDVAYEAEYLIKSFCFRDAPLWFFSIRLPHVIDKIKLIRTKLQEIKQNYDIGALRVQKNFSAQLSLKTERNSSVDGVIVGFEGKETEILEQLIGGTEQMQIISIFGMPGLGKTTFAKKLYNHSLVTYRFDKLSWCAVSQTYHRKNMLVDVLMSLTDKFDKVAILNMEEESLVEHTYKSLKGRRYLIVMDDIWDPKAWDEVRRCFPDDRNGSRILLTTRNKDVAPSGSIIHPLPFLSEEQCWELLEKKVFHNERCPSQLQGIGMEIAAKCKGLPLAVVVIAGVLSAMHKDKSAWEKVGGNLASYICDGRNNSTMQILELSYNYLPKHLRPCFLYFGAFPDDKEIPIRKLMRLWVAEGFMHKEEVKSAESAAEEYLTELIDKSLVMVAKRRSDGGAKTCVVHDLLRDLCLRKADEENFLKLMDENYSIYERHQRLCFHSTQPKSSQFLRPSFGLHVRSFFGCIPNLAFDIPNMKLLRVLDLRNTRLYHDDFVAIRLLLHLRYLAIKKMPASISTLVNLEFLVVETDYEVPLLMILKMVKLRYLHLTPLALFDEGCNISQINNLEFLSIVSINNLKDEEMLQCSPHLRELKCRCQPLLVEENGTYRYPDLSFLTQLESLKMTTFRGDKMADIYFPSNIKKLSLDGLGLPWEKMSTIGGLPNLEALKLAYDAFVGETWDTNDGEFQRLRFLKLHKLGLAEWNIESYSDTFPSLRQLVLCDCCTLQEVPCEIGEIATLQSIEVKFCSKSVAESAVRIKEEQEDMGNEQLKVIITDTRG